MYEELKEILGGAQRAVFFGGAGVSTESGVPDFRSETGLYNAVQQFGRSPEEMLSHSFFVRSTDTFYDYYKHNMIYPDVRPNKAHLALATLEQQRKLAAVATQNIDGLHQLAGSKTVYELHGSVQRNNCMDCGAFYHVEYLLDEKNCVDKKRKTRWVPYCKKCGGIIKPDVVLYEEPLDQAVMNGAVRAIQQADVLIVGGTSLVVYPAAGLINYFRGKHLVLINKSATQYDSKADLVIHDSIGQVLGECLGI